MRKKRYFTPWTLLLFIGLIFFTGSGKAFAVDLIDPAHDVAPSSIRTLLPDLDASDLETVLNGQTLVVDSRKDQGFRFLAQIPAAQELKDYVTDKKPEFFIGSLTLLPYENLSDDRVLALFNGLADIKTLSGMTSYSKAEKKVIVLFEDVYGVASPGSKTPVQDLPFESPPLTAVITAHIKDANFGSTWFSIRMESMEGAFIVSLINEKPMNIAVFKAFGTGELEMRFLLIPVKEGLLIDGLCLGNPSTEATSYIDIQLTVRRRMLAIQNWIIGRATRKIAQ